MLVKDTVPWSLFLVAVTLIRFNAIFVKHLPVLLRNRVSKLFICQTRCVNEIVQFELWRTLSHSLMITRYYHFFVLPLSNSDPWIADVCSPPRHGNELLIDTL